jgi:hypothetical protein
VRAVRASFLDVPSTGCMVVASTSIALGCDDSIDKQEGS